MAGVMGMTWGSYTLEKEAEPRRAPVASRPSGEVGAGPSVPASPGTSASSSSVLDDAAARRRLAGALTGSPAAGHDDTSLGSVAASSSTPPASPGRVPLTQGGVLA